MNVETAIHNPISTRPARTPVSALLVLCLTLVGCTGGSTLTLDEGRARRFAQLAPLADPNLLTPQIVEAERVEAERQRRAHALFAWAVTLKLKSDYCRSVADGRRLAEADLKELTRQEMQQRSEQLWSQAVDAFQKVLKMDPGAQRAARQLAHGYLDRGKVQEGLSYLKIAAELDPHDFVLQYRLGLLLERFRMPDEAIKHYQIARSARDGLIKDRLLPVLLLKLGAMLERAGKLEEATEVYEAFLKVERGPDSMYRRNSALLKLLEKRAPIYRRLGNLALRSGDAGKAIAYFRKSLKEEPDFTAAHLLLARAHVAAADIDAAEKAARAYIDAEPDAPEGYRFLITIYENQNRLDHAIKTTEELLARKGKLYRMRFLLGSMYERSGRKDDAIVCYRQIIKERRRYLPVYLKLAHIYHADGDDARALWVYSEALVSGLEDESIYAATEKLITGSKDPGKLAETMRTTLNEPERSHVFYFILAMVHQSAEEFPKAITALENSLKLDPTFIRGYLRLTGLYLRAEQSDKAIETLRKADTNGIRSVVIYRTLGDLLAVGGRFDEAAVAFEKAHKLRPWNYETTLSLADVYRELKKSERAEELLKQGLEANPGDALPWTFALGIFYVGGDSDEHLKKGIKLLEGCLEMEPTDARCLRALSAAYSRTGNHDRAILTAKQLVAADKDDLSARLLLASVYEEAGKLRRTESVLREAMGRFSEKPEAAIELGRFLMSHRRKTAEAILLLERAAAKAPDDSSTYLALGWGYEKLKRYDEAVVAITKARELSPANRHVVYILATVYQAMGKPDRAEAELRAILREHPDDPIANNALGYFFAETSRNLDEALKLIKKALAVEPGNGAYIDSLGWVYYKQGKLTDALKLLEDAFKKENDGVIAEHVGDTLYRLKRPKEAAERWERARQLDPWLDSAAERLKQLKQGKNPLEKMKN